MSGNLFDPMFIWEMQMHSDLFSTTLGNGIGEKVEKEMVLFIFLYQPNKDIL